MTDAPVGELVERLRKLESLFASDYNYEHARHMNEAASRLAELEKELKKWQAVAGGGLHSEHATRVRLAELEKELARADAMLAAHAYRIDPLPPVTWPADSVLRKAVDRHCARAALAKDHTP